eukprot:7305973-Prymnesium_polylepis.2
MQKLHEEAGRRLAAGTTALGRPLVAHQVVQHHGLQMRRNIGLIPGQFGAAAEGIGKPLHVAARR